MEKVILRVPKKDLQSALELFGLPSGTAQISIGYRKDGNRTYYFVRYKYDGKWKRKHLPKELYDILLTRGLFEKLRFKSLTQEDIENLIERVLTKEIPPLSIYVLRKVTDKICERAYMQGDRDFFIHLLGLCYYYLKRIDDLKKTEEQLKNQVARKLATNKRYKIEEE